MARQRGCVDRAKREAVLDAALELLATSARQASLGQIAARAGVSKQTLYNQYRDNGEVTAALLQRCRACLSPPTIEAADGDAVETLTQYGARLLQYVCAPPYTALTRAIVVGSWTSREYDQMNKVLSLAPAVESLERYFAALDGQIGARGRQTPPATLFVEFLTAGPILAAASLGAEAVSIDRADASVRAAICARLCLGS